MDEWKLGYGFGWVFMLLPLALLVGLVLARLPGVQRGAVLEARLIAPTP